MKHPLVKAHLTRLQAALATELISYADWICLNTRLKGKNYSFTGHEYQKTILDDPHTKKALKKCSQIGASELSLRWALAFLNVNAGTKLSYVLPSAKFAQKFIKMRFDVIVAGSPNVKMLLEKGSDSTELKQFGDSFFMAQGASASSTTNVLAVDLDSIMVDELDGAENPDVINQLISRLTHSPYQIETFLSTPTVPGYGISQKFEHSKRFLLHQTCDHCGHAFIPDYFQHVKHPELSKIVDSLREVNYLSARIVEPFDLSTAYLECPAQKCRRPISRSHILDPTSRSFICENPTSNAEFHGYHITPFAVPSVITPGSLIRRSTRYSRVQDFYNDGLGLDLDSAESGLSLDEITSFFRAQSAFPLARPPYSVLGLDMGGECACTIGYPSPDTSLGLRVIHAERIPLHRVRQRYKELCVEYRVVKSVVDAMPHTETVIAMQQQDPNLWASLFSTKRGLALFDIRERDGSSKDGGSTPGGGSGSAMYQVRGLDVARDRVLDLLVSYLRSGQMTLDPLDLQRSLMTEQLTSLKRLRVKSMDGEERFSWQKTDGNDHYFFSLAYLMLASFMISLSDSFGSSLAAMAMPLIAKLNVEKL